MSNSFAPGFLIAMPDLGDPDFFRSVVLLCSHDEQGAFGLALNNPSNMSVAEICEQTEIEWKGDDETLAYIGGPVEPGDGWVIHRGETSYEDSQRVAENLYISASQRALRSYADDPTGDYLLCLGYAGWGAGQLEAEIGSGSWITSPVSPTLIYGAEPHLLWRLALAEVGINVANLVSGNSRIN